MLHAIQFALSFMNVSKGHLAHDKARPKITCQSNIYADIRSGMAQRSSVVISSVVISNSAQVLGLPRNLSAEKYNAELRVDRMGTEQSRKSFFRAVEIVAVDRLQSE